MHRGRSRVAERRRSELLFKTFVATIIGCSLFTIWIITPKTLSNDNIYEAIYLPTKPKEHSNPNIANTRPVASKPPQNSQTHQQHQDDVAKPRIDFNDHLSEEDVKRYNHDPCKPKPTTDPELLDLPLTLVTAASSGFVGHLGNIVGSAHYWEPNLEIAVYDLGLSDDNKAQISKWCRVTIRPIDFDKYPSHVRNLRNFAWKALVVQQALEEYGKILYVDSGYEIRQPINYIRQRVNNEGYFCTGMGDSLTRGGRPGMFQHFNTTLESFLGRPMTAGGVHGGTYWGGAYNGVIKPAVECALDELCLTPPAVDYLSETRSYGKDQPLFSMQVYRTVCVQCAMDSAFTNHVAGGEDPTKIGTEVLHHRRGSGPYNGKVQTCPEWDGKSKNFEQWSKLKSRFGADFHDHQSCRCTSSTYSKYFVPERYTKHCTAGVSPLPSQGMASSFMNTVTHDKYLQIENDLKTEIKFITGAASGQFNDLKNLVGSVHAHESSVSMVIYDLGLSDAQRGEIDTWKHVALKTFDFSKYTGHVTDLKNNAWKPLVIQEAIEEYGTILFVSTSYSVVNRMEGLFFLLWRDGVFSPTIGGNLFAGVDYNSSTTRQYYKDSFNMKSVDYQWKPLCSLDLFGHVSGSIVQQQVIGPLSSCANNRDCWSPSRLTGNPSGKLDNILFSSILYNTTCYTCNRDYDYYNYDGGNTRKMTEYTFNQLMMGEHSILLYNAKEKDKYISHIQKKN
jgi:hypothetical protein